MQYIFRAFLITAAIAVLSYPTMRFVSVIFGTSMYKDAKHKEYTSAEKILQSNTDINQKINLVDFKSLTATSQALNLAINEKNFEALVLSRANINKIDCQTPANCKAQKEVVKYNKQLEQLAKEKRAIDITADDNDFLKYKDYDSEDFKLTAESKDAFDEFIIDSLTFLTLGALAAVSLFVLFWDQEFVFKNSSDADLTPLPDLLLDKTNKTILPTVTNDWHQKLISLQKEKQKAKIASSNNSRSELTQLQNVKHSIAQTNVTLDKKNALHAAKAEFLQHFLPETSILPISSVDYAKNKLTLNFAGSWQQTGLPASITIKIKKQPFTLTCFIGQESFIESTAANKIILAKYIPLQNAFENKKYRQVCNLLASMIEQTDQAQITIDQTSITQACLSKDAEEITDLVTSLERLKQTEAGILEKLTKKLRSKEADIVLDYVRAKKWHAALEEAIELERFDKIKANVVGDNLCLELTLNSYKTQGTDKFNYILPAMRIKTKFKISSSGFVLKQPKDIKCVQLTSDMPALHPHISSQGDSRACLGHAQEPLQKALANDDLLAFLQILNNWASTVSKDRIHQERLQEWCVKA